MIEASNVVVARKALEMLQGYKREYPAVFADVNMYMRMRWIVDLNRFTPAARRELHGLFDQNECLRQLPPFVGGSCLPYP